MRLSFEDFEIDLQGRQLLRNGKEVPLERRVVDMLCYLAARPGRLVEKEELLTEVWRARTLSDGALANAASKLRKALGQTAQAHSPLETVHGRGYRWRAVERTTADRTSDVEQPAAAGSDGPFVGRLSVLETLVDSAERAARGDGQLVLLRGEAGIGKSRTMKELVNRARQRGFRPWIGLAYEAEGAPAYWPWVQILRASRAELSDDVWRRQVPADSWAMSLLVPEFGDSARPASGSDVQAVRFQLFDELSRFLASASAEEPILVAIEDLHAADSGTVELLAHVARALERHAVLLVATLREFAQRGDEPHVAAINRLERIASSVKLHGLSKEEIATLVGTRAETKGADAAVAEVLFARTRGNPLFIRQLLDLLSQRGQPVDSASLATAELPTAVLDAIRQRLAVLDDGARAVLDVASAIGQEFDARLVADVLGHGREQVLTALEPSLRMGMLTAGPPAHRFAFTHGLLRDTLYDDLGLTRRAALHGQLARILAARPTRDARHLGEVARHHLEAVPADLVACVRYCCGAAEAARQASGFEAAAAFLSRALQKLESEGGDDRVRCELLHQLGIDHFCAGNVQAGWRALGQGLSVARQVGEPRLVARFACSLVDWLELGGFDEADARAAIDEALLSNDAETRAGLLARRARLAFELPLNERTALLDEATRLAESNGAPDLLLEVAVCRALLWNPTRIEDGRAAIAAVHAVVAQHPVVTLDPRFPLLRFTLDLSEYLYALVAGDMANADQVGARCAASAARLPQATLGLVADVMRAGRALREGRLDDLEAAVNRLRESATEPGALSRVWFPYAFLSSEARGDTETWSRIDLGDPSVLRELPARQHPGAYLWLSWFYTRTGRRKKARRFLAEIPKSALLRMPIQHGDLGLLAYLAEIYQADNDLEGAAWLHDKLVPFAALHAIGPAFEDRGPLADYIDMLSSMLHDETETLERFDGSGS